MVRYFRNLERRAVLPSRTRDGVVPQMHPATNLSLSHHALNSSSPSATLPGLQLRPSLPAGALSSAVVTGDFNGDGKLDWIVANAGDNTLYVYLGNGDSTSQLPLIIRLNGDSPIAIAAADLNGDGKLDLAVAEVDTNAFGILYGNGDGTFQPEYLYTVGDGDLEGLALADLNHDGHPDIIVAMEGVGEFINVDFQVWLNDGTGHFGSTLPINGPKLISDGIDEGINISIGDINGDGIPDLLVVGADAYSTTLKSYFGNGDGSFTAGKLVWQGLAGPIASNLTSAVVADVNGDGCPDITFAEDLGFIDILDNDCTGNFPSQLTFSYGVGDAGGGLAVADVNGDGHPDIIVSGLPLDLLAIGYAAGDTVTVRFNDGTGAFGPAHEYRGDPGIVALAVADLKGLGHPDIVTANQNASSSTVFTNDGAGGFGEPMGGYEGFFEGVSTGPGNAPATPTVVADVNGDGKPDLVLVETGSFAVDNEMQTLCVLLNQGAGQFSQPIRSPILPESENISDYVMADFRNIGRPDFLGLGFYGVSNVGIVPQLLYAQNLGNGQFGAPVAIPFPFNDIYTIGALAVGDFNGDGKLDFVFAAPNSQVDELSVYLGNGDGTFQTPLRLSFGNGMDIQAVFVGDANGDGKQDLFVWFSSNIEMTPLPLDEFLGNGNGTFQTPTQIFPDFSQMTMTDLNHDGLLDIVDIESSGASGFNGTIAPAINVYLGQQNGSFSPPTTYEPYPGIFVADVGGGVTYSNSYAPYMGDFNGDGNTDLAIFQFSTDVFSAVNVQFMSGVGDGTFTPTSDIFNMGIAKAPDFTGFNLLGDGRSAFVQAPNLTASYQVIPAAAAPSFQVDMLTVPVLNASDAIRISLNVPSSSDTTVTLSASNPNVQIPATVEIPAGELSIEVPFTLANAFPADQWFSITGQNGTTTAIAYSFPLPAGAGAPFVVAVQGGSVPNATYGGSTPGPGESSSWTATIISTGVGTGTFQLSCTGLPATASCADFSAQSLMVESYNTNSATFIITTQPGIAPGQYPFTVIASNGFASFSAPAVLNIGDYALSLSPASLAASPTGMADYTLTISDYFGYEEYVTWSCSNLPNGASCAPQGPPPPFGGAQPLVINLNSVLPGSYTFTVTGTSDSYSRTATAQFVVTAQSIVSMNRSPVLLGPILVGATGTAPGIALTNTGDIPLAFASIMAGTNTGSTGIFGQTNTCGANLAPGGACTIKLTFTPSAAGSFSGSLTLTDNALDSPQVLSLTGTAADFSFGTTSGGSTSATVMAGQNASYSLQFQGNQLQGAFAITCSGAPSEGTCVVSPSTVFVQGSTPVPFTVQVSTTARSSLLLPVEGRETRHAELMRFALALGICFVLYYLGRRRSLFYRLGFLALFAIVGVLVSCGGGSSGNGSDVLTGTPAGSYTLTISSQYNGGSRTLNLTLIVQ